MYIVTIVGARPQFVKAAVVSRALRAQPGLREVLVHTGQHYDANMSAVFFEELDIPRPDHDLGVGSGPHGQQTAKMLEAIERILLDAPPDWVLVYGDTNTTLAGALAAVKLHVPVAHVEAGLRSFNRRMPEEINRVLTDHVAAALFAPTQAAVENLRREGISGQRVRRVGDVMYDAALHYAAKARSAGHGPAAHGLQPGQYVLATVHRSENTDDPARLQAVVAGLAQAARQLPVLLPLHPRTRKMLGAGLAVLTAAGDLRVTPPLGYLDMVALEAGAAAIATDSGGVQKEAYFCRVPCVTLRDETEWVELVQSGANRLCPPCSPEAVAAAVLEAARRGFPADAPADLYGDGNAASSIATALTCGFDNPEGARPE